MKILTAQYVIGSGMALLNLALEKFHKNFSWNLGGSLLFELLKFANNMLLFSLLPKELYGLMGNIFACTYFAAKLIEGGAAFTLPAFFYAMQTKYDFKKIFLGFFLLPIIPIGLIISTLVIIFYYNTFLHNDSLLFTIPLLMILEAIRSLLRQFLHTAFQSKQTIAGELIIFAGYLIIVWGGIGIFKVQPTLGFLFIPYLIDSLTSIAMLSFFIYRFYTTLPNKDEHIIYEKPFLRSYVKNRIFNFLLKTSKDIFTSNFITPLFAIKFGLAEAGIFYFASNLATAIQAVIKASIGYSGSALLANIRGHSIQEKKNAFSVISSKLFSILCPLLIVLGINYSGTIQLGIAYGLSKTTIIFAILYFFIIFSEFFFLLYEQFYLVEQASESLLLCKVFEFSLFAIVIFALPISTPVGLLSQIVGVRLLTFFAVALNGYWKWRIVPTVHIHLASTLIATAIALVLKIILASLQQ